MSRADFDEIRELAFGGISGTYASVGSVTTKVARGVCFTNDTEGSVFFTNDITKDKIFVKAGSFKLWDIQANVEDKEVGFGLPIGTQISVKQIDAPVSKSVYVEFLIDD